MYNQDNMAKNTQEFETVVTLNTQQAKNNLQDLKDRVAQLKQSKDAMLSGGNYKAHALKALNKDIRQAESEIKVYEGRVVSTIETLNNLDKVSLGEIEAAVRNLKKEMKGVTNEEEYRRMDELVQKANARILELKSTVGETAQESQRLADASKVAANVLQNIDSSSLDDLKTAAQSLQEKLSKLNPNSLDYGRTANDLQRVTDRIDAVVKGQKEASQTLDEYNRKIATSTKSAQQIAEENKVIDRTLKNLSGATLRDLETSLKLVKEQINQVGRGTEDFDKLTEKAKQLDAEIKNVKDSMTEDGDDDDNIFKKSFKFLNDNWGAIVQIWAGFTGLSQTIRKCTKAFAEMDQEMTNVQKYTGQTKEEVVEMNEDFKKMNTRTSREELNQLAGAAGRLGKTGTKDIEDFVDAADKINVALGDDLGDKAVDQIGKLAMMFGEDKRMNSLKNAMLATGSAVNELAQSSSASAGYLVDFSARLAGVGKQAGLTQQQIMGYASVLDQNMQQDETSATALQNLISKMFQDPAKFAKLAGKNIQEFSTLLKTDANEALMQFFAALKAKGGFAELAPMFEEMSLDGSRSVAVLSVMADKLDDVRTAQSIANKAYAEGKSVINEFNTQMSSEQAALDMAKKSFKELTVELGEQLLPVAKYTISTGAIMVKTLSTLITFVKNHLGGLVSLTASITTVAAVYYAAAIKAKLLATWTTIVTTAQKAGAAATVAYTAVVKTMQIAFYVLTGNIKKAKQSLDAMRLASITNPYAAMTAVILALAAGIITLIASIRKHNKAIHDNLVSVRQQREAAKDMNEAIKERNKSTAEERTKLERLTNIINSNVYSLNEKKAAMIALEKIVPGYHRNLQNEATLTANNNKALREYVQRLNDAAMAQALYNRMVELQGQKFDLETEIARHKQSQKAVQAEIDRHPEVYNETKTVLSVGAKSYLEMPTEANKQKHDELKSWVKLTEKANDNLKVVQGRLENINAYMDKNKGVRKEFDKLVSAGKGGKVVTPEYSPGNNGGGNTGGGNGGGAKTESDMDKETKKRYQEEIKLAKGKTEKEQAENIFAYSQGKKTYTQFLDDQHTIAINGYKALEEIYKKYGTDYGQWQDEIAKEEQKKQQDHSKAMLEQISENRDREIQQSKMDFEDPNSEIYHNEEALNERLFEIDMSALADRVAALQEGSEEWMDAKAEMVQREEEHALELRQHYAELVTNYRKEWGQKDSKMEEEIALQGIDSLHAKGLIKEEEYQQMLKNIKLHYAQQQSEDNVANSKGEQFKNNAHSAYTTASNNANAEYQNEHPEGTGVLDYYTSDVSIYQSTLANIKKMEEEGVITHQESMAAMSEATGNMCNGMASKMQAAYDQVTPILSGLSSYYSAQSDYEVAVTEKKYEKLIDKAGNNTAKTKKLEEKKEKEVAKIKSKYAKKQAAMQIAQAIANTAISAIAAYGSAMSGIPYPANMVMAPIAAGIALAAGALQIATIKKQQQAQEAGYYSGGFTGGSSYRQTAGVVHQGEFVANHNAVNNPQLLPALRLIDLAQRNNTVGQLTANDVSQAMGIGSAAVVQPTTVNVHTDNSELASTLGQMRDTTERLGTLLDEGVSVQFPMENFKKAERHWENLQKNK